MKRSWTSECAAAYQSLVDAVAERSAQRWRSALGVGAGAHRAMLWRIPSGAHPMDAHKVDSRAIYRLSKGVDAKEGVQSFLEKRPPAFPGKVSADMPDFYPWWEEPTYE